MPTAPRQPSCWPLRRPARRWPAARLLLNFRPPTASGRARGASLTDALGRVPSAAPRHPGAGFTALRRLGAAQALRQQLAPRHRRRASMRCCSPPSRYCGADDAPYADHTLVDQAVQTPPGSARRPRRASSMPCCDASCGSARPGGAAARRDRWRLQPPAGGGSKPSSATGLPVAGHPRRQQPPAAHGAARQRPPHQRQRLPDALAHGASPPAWSGPRCRRRYRAGPTPPVQDLPGFAAGDVSVQDAAAQLARWLAQASRPRPRAGRLCRPWRQDRPFAGLQSSGPAGQRRRRPAPAARAENLLRLGLRASSRPPTPARPPRGGTAALRRHPARRALQRRRHRAPSPRRALAAPARWPTSVPGPIQTELMDALWPCSARPACCTPPVPSFAQRAGPDRRVFATPDAQPWTFGSAGHRAAAARPSRTMTGGLDGFFYALHFLKPSPAMPRRPPCPWLALPGCPGWAAAGSGPMASTDAVPDRTHDDGLS